MLSDREQLSWLPETYADDDELLESIKTFCEYLDSDVLDRTRVFMRSISDYDLSKIYIRNDAQLTDISKWIFGDWNLINKARELAYDLTTTAKKGTARYEDNRKKALNAEKSVTIATLNECIKLLPEEYCEKQIDKYFSELRKVDHNEGDALDLIEVIKLSNTNTKQLLTTPYPEDYNLIQDKANVALIKSLLDSVSNLQRFLKPLIGYGDESDKDQKFYGELNYIWEALNQIIPLYNMVRNYLTRKPYSTEKIKLNFGNSQLLNGWDRNKERDNTSIILRKDGNYYLAIMDKKHNKSFDANPLPNDGDCYEKMDYKLLPGPNKMLPKVFLSKKGIETFKPSKELLEKYALGTHKKGENFNIQYTHKLIDFFKESINAHVDWRHFDFDFSETSTYSDISGFYREVEHQGYKVTFRNVSVAYVDSLVNDGKLYLFQIYNKDFSPYSKGTPNLHTLYWKMLFDERNLADVVYKLNGQAEVFFRKRSLRYEQPTHPAHQPIKKKNAINKGEESLFEYDLIKDRRYTLDKFQFHVPITMNFKSVQGDRVNQLVQDYIRSNKDIHVIGIDRGERHLLYISVIDGRGNIVEQFSLNEIINHHNGNEYKTDYHGLLETRNAQRQKERQNWQTIEGIKDLKQGYLSQVVHKVSQLMIKYNAIVALEDLNMGFKRGRQKVESSVYQQFEKQLIDKLNYLVDKKLDPHKEGGLLKAYQLTSPFKSIREMGKQNGFLFYIPAWNTSKIDPVTGFVNLFNTRYESVDNSKAFFEKFDSINYHQGHDWFEFKFDYNKFNRRAEGTQTKWVLCTHGDRIMAFRNSQKNSQWDYKDICLTNEFKALFEEYQIDYHAKDSIQDDIIKVNDKDFFVRLLILFRLLVQMRNSRKETDEDYLISPIADANGNFYDSRDCGQNLPKNADANGAYNIALKGLWALQTIRDTEEEKKPKLGISNKEWLNFIQKKPFQNR
ncbi:type V CRISPR-associated protein Cas12a/Cpf1 [Porphyromonadaceae bacterium W3.11]|nr:type V CRISPR-associated protein Cas12a/Cpf1 [Porphyromonadaceae bacterium W3.11]